MMLRMIKSRSLLIPYRGTIQFIPVEGYAPVASTLQSDRTGRNMHLPSNLPNTVGGR